VARFVAAQSTVEQLTKFVFGINLISAKAPGLAIPPTQLNLVDGVIE
jgi:hypothetical protein